METENLFDVLHGDTLDQSELEQLLSGHFGLATANSPQEIEYRYVRDGPPALVLSYDGNGELDAVHPGPALKSTDISELKARIEHDLLAPGESVIGMVVLFAHLPTTGWFRYKDVFQIVPVPKDAPRPSFLAADHPLVLEFRFTDSIDRMVGIQRRARIAREIELLCVALSSSLKGSLGINARHHWVIPEEADINSLKSRLCQELYTWPGALGQAQEFSSITATAPVARAPHVEYYSRRGISPDQVVDLPDSMEECLDAFFALPRAERDRFLRASYWFRHAQHTFAHSQSASFTALVSAIEALMSAPSNTETCITCGRNTGPGPTKLFIDFVERYAPSPTVPRAERRKLYALRSALSHGGNLLHTDREAWSPGLTPDRIRQWERMDGMWQIVRVALVHWLMDKSGGGEAN